MDQKNFQRIIFWGIFASCLVNVAGWFLVLREGEATRLAATTMQILQTYDQKGLIAGISEQISDAPLVLWLSGISMAALGNNHIAYRIPGFLISLFSLFCINRLARIYHTPPVSRLATLIAATLQSTFILNENVDANTYTTAFYTFMIWQLAAALKERKLQNFVLSIIGFMLVILAKGTITGHPAHFAPLDLPLKLLWSFGPWTLFLIAGLGTQLVNTWKGRAGRKAYHLVPLYAFLVPFILLSLNPYQTDTDAFIVYPLGALFAAEFIAGKFYSQSQSPRVRSWYISQIILCYAVLAILFWLVWYPFADNNYYGLIHYLGTLSIITWLVFFSSFQHKLLLCCVVLAIGSNLVLNSYYYPNLSRYQAGPVLGRVAKTDGVTSGRLFSYQAGAPYSLTFYSGVQVRETADFKRLITQKHCWIYTDQRFLEEFRAARPDVRILGNSNDFPVSGISSLFLNPETRDQAISQKILIRL